MEGTNTTVRFAFIASLIQSPVSVLPVPQAMRSWPRFFFFRCATAASIASCWWGLGSYFSVSAGALSDSNEASIPNFNRSALARWRMACWTDQAASWRLERVGRW